MFVGYSLNDYNLNLIIGWINYFQKHYKITERPKSFLIDTKAPLHHECIRQESRNIFVINIADLPKELTDNVKVPEDLTAIPGKQLFTFLRIITDEDMLAKVTPFEEILRDKFSVFDSYNKVSHDDLINTQDFGPVLFQGTEMTFYHYEDYKRLEEVIKNGDSKILDVFQRAGISSINCYEKIEEEIEIPVLDETDNMFMLYINNDYKAIEKSIEGIADPDERLYYLKLINNDQSKIYKAIEESEQSLKRHDFTSILLSKMRYRLSLLTLFDRQQTLTKELDQLFHTVPMRYQDSTKYLRMLFESMSNKLFEMQKVLDEQDKRNKYGSNTWESGHAFKHIWKLKASAYNYYFFVKKNYLPVDYFTDPRRFLRYYIQAILCSYMPVDTNTGNDLFGFPTHHEHYKLNSIDLDIFIKFSDSKELESWLKKYSVNSLEFEGDVDLVQKYKNLCESYVEIHNASWKDSLLNFTRILCLAGLNDDDKRNAFSILVSALEASITKSDRLIEDLFEALDYYYNNCTINGADLQKKQLLHVLLIEEVINVLRQSHDRQWSQMINKLFVIADTDLQTELIQRIDNISDINKKASCIHRFRKAIPDNYYDDWLIGNVNAIWTGTLFGLIVSNQIGFTTEIQQRFVDVIESEVLERIKVPGIRSYPDRLSETIEQCIIMKLIGISFDISLLGKYAGYSSCLQFILNPLEFNYNQVDTRNVMWQNLMYSDEYGKYFKMNKETILTDELQLVLRGGLATVAQQKVVYGLLLDRDELRGY